MYDDILPSPQFVQYQITTQNFNLQVNIEGIRVAQATAKGQCWLMYIVFISRLAHKHYYYYTQTISLKRSLPPSSILIAMHNVQYHNVIQHTITYPATSKTSLSVSLLYHPFAFSKNCCDLSSLSITGSNRSLNVGSNSIAF